MLTRRHAREWALQALYLSDTSRLTAEEVLLILRREFKALGSASSPFAWELYEGTLRDLESLDVKIQACADNWDIRRMSTVDRNLLRLAAHELLGGHGTPVAVVIDESLEIAKKYSSADSSRFLNGVLDKVKHYKDAKKSGDK